MFFTLLHQLAFRLQGNRVTGVQITAPACKIKSSTVILADEGCWTGVPLKMQQEVKVELNTGLKNGEIIFFRDEHAFSTFLNNCKGRHAYRDLLWLSCIALLRQHLFLTGV